LDKAKKARIGQTYLNDKTHLEIIEIIVSNEVKTVQQLLKEASFFIFVMAGSFDITGDELETTYLRNGLNGGNRDETYVNGRTKQHNIS